ncbi:5'-AMP-activated protein kinase subunit beta-2 isoform X2 [Alligator mississippiensis]|uniref:5'-AMP-activated protein kinase subunit beta-2 isoform X2 n=1 Tax=Alligator mississippiensis TaxID=8496 RepID=UPI0007119906|nr:5'-AMP-activated protein kinase subunit beta-2 isoform X2 [Alligator mississippiensis]
MGNTTSERVSGERHGSKSHRSDGASSAHSSKEHPHKIMVGSTDDPNVFSTHDSKSDLDESAKPVQQARPTVIRWADGGKEVFISGSFNNWSAKIPLIKSHNDFVAILDLPEGEHQYKFFVDGQWVHDPSEPVVTSQMGTINNLIHVKKSDFEVFDALKVDSLESSETSCRDLSSSPPGPYGQEMYVYRPEERFKSPPILPPHLLQVILNKDTNISCDPALLPEPNHVMLNHLYALSIKESSLPCLRPVLLECFPGWRLLCVMARRTPRDWRALSTSGPVGTDPQLLSVQIEPHSGKFHLIQSKMPEHETPDVGGTDCCLLCLAWSEDSASGPQGAASLLLEQCHSDRHLLCCIYYNICCPPCCWVCVGGSITEHMGDSFELHCWFWCQQRCQCDHRLAAIRRIRASMLPGVTSQGIAGKSMPGEGNGIA